MRRHFIKLFLLFSVMIQSCSKEESRTTKLEKLLPMIDGWKLSEKPKIYTHDNLFDYIDGNCELYFSYRFNRLVSGLYTNENDPAQTVTVDIYDMTTPLNAFGVYSSMSHPDYSYEKIGCEAVISPQQIRFWQNHYEVEINSGEPKAGANEILSKLARRVSQNLPECQPLAELRWLPQQDQVPHTLKYVADGFLGQNFLPGGMEAMYKVDGREVRGFVAKCKDTDHAKSCLNQYREAQFGFEGAKVQEMGNHFESYHQYTRYVRAGFEGSWFYGARSQTNADDCRKVAEMIGASVHGL